MSIYQLQNKGRNHGLSYEAYLEFCKHGIEGKTAIVHSAEYVVMNRKLYEQKEKANASLLQTNAELVGALEGVVSWFEKMKKDHDAKLGKSFAEACENWDTLLQEPLNMEPLIKALTNARSQEVTPKMNEDQYGTVLRERMKQSMSKPASFKPLNMLDKEAKRSEQYDRISHVVQVGVATVAVVLVSVLVIVNVYRYFYAH